MFIAAAQSRMALYSRSTNQGPPHLEEASGRRLAFPSGTAQGRPGQPGPLEGPKLAQRRIPRRIVSLSSLHDLYSLPYQGLVANKLSGEPEEWLLKVVVGFGGDVVVLEVLLAVEGDGLGLDLALLYINLVSSENDGNVLADTDKITCETISIQPLNFRCSMHLRCQFGTFL